MVFTMKFEFDEEKIKKNMPELDIELCSEWLDEICSDTRFTKIGKNEYKLNEGVDDIGTLVILISRFKQQSWLLPNLKSWITYSDDEGEQDALSIVMGESADVNIQEGNFV